MKGKYYKELTKKIVTGDATERYRIINVRIDEIIKNDSNPKQALEALICTFEGRMNNAMSYSIMSVLYAVVLTIISLFEDSQLKTIMSWVLCFVGFVLYAIVIYVSRQENKEGFILSALRLRYEKEYARNDITKVQEKEYFVKVKEYN